MGLCLSGPSRGVCSETGEKNSRANAARNVCCLNLWHRFVKTPIFRCLHVPDCLLTNLNDLKYKYQPMQSISKRDALGFETRGDLDNLQIA